MIDQTKTLEEVVRETKQIIYIMEEASERQVKVLKLLDKSIDHILAQSMLLTLSVKKSPEGTPKSK